MGQPTLFISNELAVLKALDGANYAAYSTADYRTKEDRARREGFVSGLEAVAQALGFDYRSPYSIGAPSYDYGLSTEKPEPYAG